VRNFLRNQAITKQNDCRQKSGSFHQSVNPFQDEAKESGRKKWEIFGRFCGHFPLKAKNQQSDFQLITPLGNVEFF
jgi:hypothetical protein